MNTPNSFWLVLVVTTIGVMPAFSARAGNASQPLGDPVLETPTLQCLGAYWIIRGDDNQNARVECSYRAAGDTAWQRGSDLFRVEQGVKLERGQSLVEVPVGAWLFAGSVVLLESDTEYELRLKLLDPDGGGAEKQFKTRTLAEPTTPKDARVLHVVPGVGNGIGTTANPFHGLVSAQAQARAGDLFLLHGGTYSGTFLVNKSGAPGRPIVWRGAGDGEVIIDAQGQAAEPPQRAVSASDIHDVWFERLTITRALWGLVAHDSQRVVVRRCHFHHVRRGLTATRNSDGHLGGLFIADNLLEGPYQWSDRPHGASVEEDRGIEFSGSGNVVCYNRVRGFKDGIDAHPGPCCVASDIHNNEVSECLDDGCEMDGSERNMRCFRNRFVNIFQGISVQPVYGGPVYVFRNALYNMEAEVFKMHNSPSGALFLHNTCVKQGPPVVLWTNARVRHCITRNNLFIGTGGPFAFESTAPMVECDFDFDGFGGGPWPNFLKWNGLRFKTVEEARDKAPVYHHALALDATTLFASGLRPPEETKRQFDPISIDLRLKPDSAAAKAGVPLPGFGASSPGQLPALGAYEIGSPVPHYGPRPEDGS